MAQVGMVEVGCTEAHVSHTQQGPFQGPVWVVGDSGLGVGHFGKPHVAGVDDHACPSPQASEVFEDRQLGGQPELDGRNVQRLKILSIDVEEVRLHHGQVSKTSDGS